MIKFIKHLYKNQWETAEFHPEVYSRVVLIEKNFEDGMDLIMAHNNRPEDPDDLNFYLGYYNV